MTGKSVGDPLAFWEVREAAARQLNSKLRHFFVRYQEEEYSYISLLVYLPRKLLWRWLDLFPKRRKVVVVVIPVAMLGKVVTLMFLPQSFIGFLNQTEIRDLCRRILVNHCPESNLPLAGAHDAGKPDLSFEAVVSAPVRDEDWISAKPQLSKA